MSIKTDNTQTLVNALAEIERLRGRVAELESEIEFITGLGSKLTQAATLRKQAEAVEHALTMSVTWQEGYAQRLRQQADELENNNAQEH